MTTPSLKDLLHLLLPFFVSDAAAPLWRVLFHWPHPGNVELYPHLKIKSHNLVHLHNSFATWGNTFTDSGNYNVNVLGSSYSAWYISQRETTPFSITVSVEFFKEIEQMNWKLCGIPKEPKLSVTELTKNYRIWSVMFPVLKNYTERL